MKGIKVAPEAQLVAELAAERSPLSLFEETSRDYPSTTPSSSKLGAVSGAEAGHPRRMEYLKVNKWDRARNMNEIKLFDTRMPCKWERTRNGVMRIEK